MTNPNRARQTLNPGLARRRSFRIDSHSVDAKARSRFRRVYKNQHASVLAVSNSGDRFAATCASPSLPQHILQTPGHSSATPKRFYGFGAAPEAAPRRSAGTRQVQSHQPPEFPENRDE